MGFFAVTVQEIEGTFTHPDPEVTSIELAKVRAFAYQFVVRKGAFKPGDRVVYFPPDAQVPADVQGILGVVGKLSGNEKDRIKTIRLRGAISQGIVAPLGVFPMLDQGVPTGTDVTEALKVTKYDPPPEMGEGGLMVPLPAGMSKYDVESCDNFPDVVPVFMDQRVYVSEKLEGENLMYVFYPEGLHCQNINLFQLVPYTLSES